MNDKKYFYIMIFSLVLLLVLGVSYAWFNAVIKGNDTAKEQKVVTGNLELTFTDDTEVTLPNAVPGDSYTKTISVKNTGTLDAKYNLVWQELTNEITNDELVIEATCKRLNSSNTEEGTCESISQTPIKSSTIKRNISIEPSVTHEYIIKVTFIDTGSLQDYNKKKSFSGKLGIEEYKAPDFATDSWSTIIANVKAGNGSEYKVGSTKEVNLGSTYGTHTLRVANTSTPSECSTEGFSQSACGFVLEFADIITTHNMNPVDEYKGTFYNYGWNLDGWPASSMHAFVNNDIYNSIPDEIKNAIIDTVTVSGHGSTSGETNFTSTDKLYLLSPKEMFANFSSVDSYDNSDTAKDLTRTLDYYKNIGVTTSSYSGAIKKNGTNSDKWWLRTAYSNVNNAFFRVAENGSLEMTSAKFVNGVSPAFRIG